MIREADFLHFAVCPNFARGLKQPRLWRMCFAIASAPPASWRSTAQLQEASVFSNLRICKLRWRKEKFITESCLMHMGMGQNPVPLVNPQIAGKWMFIPLKMVVIGIDPFPYNNNHFFPTTLHQRSWSLASPVKPRLSWQEFRRANLEWSKNLFSRNDSFHIKLSNLGKTCPSGRDLPIECTPWSLSKFVGCHICWKIPPDVAVAQQNGAQPWHGAITKISLSYSMSICWLRPCGMRATMMTFLTILGSFPILRRWWLRWLGSKYRMDLKPCLGSPTHSAQHGQDKLQEQFSRDTAAMANCSWSVGPAVSLLWNDHSGCKPGHNRRSFLSAFASSSITSILPANKNVGQDLRDLWIKRQATEPKFTSCHTCSKNQEPNT